MFGVVLAISKAHARASTQAKITLPRMFKQCFCQEMLQPRQPLQRIRAFSNWRTSVSNSRTWSYKTDALIRIGYQQLFKARSNIFQFFRNSSSSPSPSSLSSPPANPLKVNTNVINNVMLYRYERPYLYKGAFIFSIFGLIGCLSMVDNVYLILTRDLFNPDIDWLVRLKRNGFSLAAMLIGIIAGPMIMFTVWYITKRSVKYVVLHKGGKAVTFVNYHPIKGEVKLTVPANAISCKSGRIDKKGYLPIKLKNRKNHLIIDKDGHFVNQDLFDSVIAVQRF